MAAPKDPVLKAITDAIKRLKAVDGCGSLSATIQLADVLRKFTPSVPEEKHPNHSVRAVEIAETYLRFKREGSRKGMADMKSQWQKDDDRMIFTRAMRDKKLARDVAEQKNAASKKSSPAKKPKKK